MKEGINEGISLCNLLPSAEYPPGWLQDDGALDAELTAEIEVAARAGNSV